MSDRHGHVVPVLALLLLPCLAVAQPVATFERLGEVLNAGDGVRIVEWSGRVVSGDIADLTPDALALARGGGATERVARADVREVSMRRRDSLRNGLLIGFASTAVPYCALAISSDSAAQCGLAATFIGGIGAGLGALVDAVITRRTVVFRAVDRPVAAAIWPVRRGAAVGAVLRW
jgi:hypothetical protein